MFKKNEEDFVKNINERRKVRSQFVVTDKIIKTARSGRKYIDVNLKDKTGQVVGRLFPEESVEDVFNPITLGKIYRILGHSNEYPQGSGRFNIIINVIKQLSEEEYDINDFITTSGKNKEELISQITSTIKEIENEDLKKLLKAFFDDKEFTEEFYNAPSAKINHHNYSGGLLEHTVGVLEICKTTYKLYPELNKDLLYTGAILHDVGKLKTYDYDLVQIDFSEEGRLIDHLVISYEMIRDKIRELKTPKEISIQLLHMILSHHGEVRNGWGSPVNPKTPEAIALHHADNLDAKVKGKLQEN